MTRHILTTATLVAFLAAGQTPIPAGERRRDSDLATTASVVSSTPSPVLRLGQRLLAVHATATSHGIIDVALQGEGREQPEIRLWAGRKNGWGSVIAVAAPVAGLDAFQIAQVPLPESLPSHSRLWIALLDQELRPSISSVPLPHPLIE